MLLAHQAKDIKDQQMNKKQLAEMIKTLRKKKMEEQGSTQQQSKSYLEKEKFHRSIYI